MTAQQVDAPVNYEICTARLHGIRKRMRTRTNVRSYFSNTLRAGARDILKEVRNRRPENVCGAKFRYVPERSALAAEETRENRSQAEPGYSFRREISSWKYLRVYLNVHL